MSTIHDDIYQKKKVKLQILMMYPECDVCGKDSQTIYYKDESNWSKGNLVPLCFRCHSRLTTKVRFMSDWNMDKTRRLLYSKFQDKYEMAEALGLSYPTVNKMIEHGIATDKTMTKVTKVLDVTLISLR